MYVAYSRPNGWSDWAEMFCCRGVLQAKKTIFFQNICSYPRATPGSSASITKKHEWVEHSKSESQGLEFKSSQIIIALYLFMNLRSM